MELKKKGKNIKNSKAIRKFLTTKYTDTLIVSELFIICSNFLRWILRFNSDLNSSIHNLVEFAVRVLTSVSPPLNFPLLYAFAVTYIPNGLPLRLRPRMTRVGRVARVFRWH